MFFMSFHFLCRGRCGRPLTPLWSSIFKAWLCSHTSTSGKSCPLLIGSSETGTTCKLRRRRRVDALTGFATMGCRISGKICCSCICYNASDPESSLLWNVLRMLLLFMTSRKRIPHLLGSKSSGNTIKCDELLISDYLKCRLPDVIRPVWTYVTERMCKDVQVSSLFSLFLFSCVRVSVWGRERLDDEF